SLTGKGDVMRTRTRLGAAAAAAVALLLAGGAGRAQAGLIVSSLSPTPPDSALGGPFEAQSFTVGGVSQTLGSVTLRLFNPLTVDETVTVNLYSDNSGRPGSSLLTLGSFTIPAQTLSFADHTLSAPSAFTLQANTTYWLVEAES